MKKLLMSALALFAMAAVPAVQAEKAAADTSKATTYVVEMTGVT